MAAEQNDLLRADMESLFNRGKHPLGDLEIVCGDQTWQLHKIILVPRCEFIRKALGTAFVEGQTSRIKLPNDKPHAVHTLLHYLYTRTWDISDSVGNESGYNLIDLMEVCKVADKYGAPYLIERASHCLLFPEYLNILKERHQSDWRKAILVALAKVMDMGKSPEVSGLRQQIMVQATLLDYSGLATDEETVIKSNSDLAIALLGHVSALKANARPAKRQRRNLS